MAYIGNTPAEAYISISSQTFTTINGTGYTLSSSVTTSEDIALFLNNVRQKPSTYTAAALVLTMGTATTTADELYCVYLGKALQTVNPPAASVGTSSITDLAVTTAKLAGDAVTTAKILDDNVTTDKILDANVTTAKTDLVSTASVAAVTAKGTAGVSDGYVTLNCDQNTHGIKLKSPPHSAAQSYTLTFPQTAPATDKILQTNASGQLSFVTETETDLTGLNQDILTLALRNSIDNNSAKYNLPHSAVTHYESDADYDSGGSTDIVRSSSEYLYAAAAGAASYTTYTTGSGSFTVPASITSVEALVVAGGGGGGASNTTGETGSGGGGGGVVHHATLATTPAGTIAYSVGASGAAGTTGSREGGNGGNSTFGSITALGGGGGSGVGGVVGIDGGSGGGAGRGNATGGSATQGDSGGGTGYGNDGGAAASGNSNNSGGGGGAAAVGATSTLTNGGAGGAGRLFSNFTSYGVSGYFAGGGGGGGTSSAGAGGSGGGGAGGDGGVSGTANTGGGAGGVITGGTGGVGGSGFIGLRYAVEAVSATGTALGTTKRTSKCGHICLRSNISKEWLWNKYFRDRR